jgi:EAL domain-containing protein (putative c-di-GMP-specific phosphodiesterase class I)
MTTGVGDEFAVLLENLEHPDQADAIAERLRLALRAPITVREREYGAPKVTVNVSAAQLRSERFARDVAVALARHELPPDRLLIEITESIAVARDPETLATLAALRQLGVSLALDDFGTGYSSLGYLAHTNVDLLKLDRAFLAGIDTDDVQARLVAGVLQLAESLGVAVIAEGIERPDQRQRILELGGRLGQGYLISKPVDAATLTDHITTGSPARRRHLHLAS